MDKSPNNYAELVLMELTKENPLLYSELFDLRKITNKLQLELSRAELGAVRNYLIRGGYLRDQMAVNDEGVGLVVLSETGLVHGRELLSARKSKKIAEKIRLFFDRWVGVVALLSLIATIVACYFAYRAVPN